MPSSVRFFIVLKRDAYFSGEEIKSRRLSFEIIPTFFDYLR